MTQIRSDRRLTALAGVALAVANARYWLSVWPLVRAELRRWELRASSIENDELRALALEKLRVEAFNAEVAATLATLAPRKQRKATIEAIVALEVLFDYLDGLTEMPSAEALRDARSLSAAILDALGPAAASGRHYFRHHPTGDDDGYLDALSSAVRSALARLPATDAVLESARRSMSRCAEGQIRIHAEPWLGVGQLQEWAAHEARGTQLEWRELAAAAASSVLAVHALIAAAADPLTTAEEASAIEAAYLSICVLITVLDSLVDHDADVQAGEPGFIRFYDDRDVLAATLACLGERAVSQAAGLRCGPHHVMTFAGVVAYYTSAPAAQEELARPIALRLRSELSPLIYPSLAVMRAWRAAKRVRSRFTPRHRRRRGGVRS